MTNLSITVGIALAPIFALLVLAGIVASLLQVGPMLTSHPIKPDFSKISPMAGLGRIFSTQS